MKYEIVIYREVSIILTKLELSRESRNENKLYSILI